MASSATQQIINDPFAQYMALLNKGAQTAPAYGTQVVEGPQGVLPSLVGKLAPTAVKEGIKYLMAPSAAAPTMSSAAIESVLSGGANMTPLSPSMYSTPVGDTLASFGTTAAPTDITNFAGSATPYLGAAGAALGTYGALKGIHEKNPMGAGLGALGAGLGINAMGFALGPAGWAAMLAAPVAGALINKHLDKDEWKTESKRLNKLKKNGTFVPEALLASMPTAGRSKSELLNRAYAADFIGRGSGNEWVNNKFSQSRNESDLRPEDIVGYSTFAEKDKDWFNKPLDVRLAEAKKALDAGAVREHKGTIDVDWNKIAAAVANG